MKPLSHKLGVIAATLLLVTRALAGGSPPPDLNEAPAAAPATPAAPASATPFDLRDQARIKAGKQRFHSTCAEFCHGHTPPLFIGRKDLPPQYAFDMISNGGGTATPMPPWGSVFTQEEIWELVAYLKYLGTQKPI